MMAVIAGYLDLLAQLTTVGEVSQEEYTGKCRSG